MNSTEKKASVLIVDDTPVNIKMLVRALKDAYRVRVATRGRKALEIAQSDDPPDLILLDVMMPEMDGFEVCRQLKADPRLQDIPVIFVTALGDTEHEVKGFKAGAVDYVTKPLQIQTILSRVNTHLELCNARKKLEKQNEILRENALLRDHVERITRHDLRAPLGPIMALPEILLEEPNITQDQKTILHAIAQSGRRMLLQLEQSLNVFKIETGSYTFTPQNVDIGQVIMEVVQASESKTNSHAVSISIDLPGEMSKSYLVKAEEPLCFSMLSNILNNAVEASDIGATVSISLKNTPEYVELTVKNASEIPEEIRDCISDKYVTAGKKSGTGLGTYSAKLLADIQQADIQWDSSTPGATIVRIRFKKDLS